MAREQLVEERYGLLRFIITVVRAVGALQIIGGVVFGLSLALSEQRTSTLAGLRFDSVLEGVLGFAIMSFGGLLTYGFGELIQVVIDIEENTRATERAASASPARLRDLVSA
jgi:hypothetical protein